MRARVDKFLDAWILACVFISTLAFPAALVVRLSEGSRPPEPSGVLTDGNPATEENVLAACEKLMDEYPSGTPWGGRDVPGTEYNRNPVSVTSHVVIRQRHETSDVYGCGGFAALVSDRVFGPGNRRVRVLNDVRDVRPGDVIVAVDEAGETVHVMMAMSRALDETGATLVAHGNAGGVVSWPDPENSDANVRRPGETGARWVVYSRYPS